MLRIALDRSRTGALAPLLALSVLGAWTGTARAADVPATASPPEAAASAPAIPPRLPLEAFASVPQLTGVALSPDGKQVVALINVGDSTALTRLDVDGSSRKVLVSTDNKRFFFRWARWVGNDRVLASVRFAAQRDFTDTQEVRLLSIKADGSDMFNLTKPEVVRGSLTGAANTIQIQDDIIDWRLQDGRFLLLSLTPAGASTPAVFKVDVTTGNRTMVQAPVRDVQDWVVDSQHRVRVGVKMRDGQFEVIARDPGSKDDRSDWRTLWRFKQGEPSVWPMGFGKDDQELYVRATHEGRDAVFAVRLDQPDLPRRLLLAHPRYDVTGGLLQAPATGEVLGLTGSGWSSHGEKRAELWSDTWRQQMKAIDEALPHQNNRLAGISEDGQRYLVVSSGNGVPPAYFLGNRADGKLALIGETYPDLPPEDLAGKRAAHIRARDGLTLEAFLTVPKGHAGGPLPLILMPHGGPQSWDDLDFDYWTEFLANRRYAVLQVNFRGSAGQGDEFSAAGLRRWGLEMQDDLSDAVQWAVSQGIADPARVCIVGGSYGGYAALMGLVKTPALYKCGVSFAGVTDLQDLIAYQSRYIGGQEWAEYQIGRYWGDRSQLRATSPALQASRIQAPVLLVHGTDDRTVPVSQSEDMAKALRSAGKPYRYVEQEGGDHHLSRSSHRLQFFKELETFLDQQLKPGTPMSASAANKAETKAQ